MPKILTDREMAEIITRAVTDDLVIDCSDSYCHFMEDLAELITTHFGGEAGEPIPPDAQHQTYRVPFCHNQMVPEDGGIFKGYDEDVLWEDGTEVIR